MERLAIISKHERNPFMKYYIILDSFPSRKER
nr:MAG TPA: hypothetical protein [Caudoviricetes sp.]DAW36945.1 MAG TPA: hypothetical protein [Caudoviricetes sp.]